MTVRDILQAVGTRILRRRLQRSLGHLGVCFVASNCVGSRLSMLMEEPFRSPTVDLWMPPDDFIRFLGAIEAYRELQGAFRADSEETARIGYPVGLLGGPGLADVRVYFQHFPSVEAGAAAWTRRFERLELNRAVLVFAQKEDVTEQHLKAFDAMPFAKVAFTHRPYPHISSAAWVPGLRRGDVGDLFGSWWRLVFALTDRRLSQLRQAITA